MKILVFGKNGQIARSLADLVGSHKRIDPIFLAHNEFTISEAGILDQVINSTPEFIVNCCAYTDVEGAEDDYENAYRVNALLPQYIGKAAHRVKTPVIHFSTDYVFDGTKDSAYLITDEKNSLSVYGKTKSDGEDFLLAETSDAYVLRTSWVYSPYGKNFFITMFNLLQSRESLSIISDQIGAPTAAHELASSILSIISQPKNYPLGIHHVTSSGETSWFGFANEIQNLMNENAINTPTVISKILTKNYPTKAKRPLNSRLHSDIFCLKSWQDSLNDVFKHRREINL